MPAAFRVLSTRWMVAVATLATVLSSAARARAEVPKPPEAGREFRVDFSARHLDVDVELGELSLSGDVVVTVGRYRLGGDRVRLQRGPRGISVKGGGDIAFCSCENPPVSLGYSTVTVAPPSDVIVQNAVLRAGGVPLFWLPYLWLRSPDRVGLIFPSVEWRGDDGLLLGSGVHVPFSSNQGRLAARAFDLGAYGYLQGGVRLDGRLLTPQSTSFVRWDHRAGTALTIDAHGAISGEGGAVWAYDVDASRGVRGRAALSSLDAAARPYDHARLGVGSSGRALLAVGLQADGIRGDWLDEPASVGPFAQLATGGSLGRSASYALDLTAGSWLRTGQLRSAGHETRGLQRGTLESSVSAGPALLRLGAFEQGEWVAIARQAVAELRAGGGARLSLPLMRRFARITHAIEPNLTGRLERVHFDGNGANVLVATGGIDSSFGAGARGAAAAGRVAAGVAGDISAPEAVTEVTLGSDARLFGVRLSGVAEPTGRAAEATAKMRIGARAGTALIGFVEARTQPRPLSALRQSGGDVLPAFHERGGYDRAGVTAGGDLTLNWATSLWLGGGADVDVVDERLLAVRSFARYRHGCRCVALGGFASKRIGRGGFDAGLSVDLMP